jgi:glycine/D-amino acid oxidase-like deaminating enzyme
MSRNSVEIAVLGAGLTGSCAALELAHQGFDVLLIDRDDQAMNRASLRNEGKIHLGLIYANDPTMATGYLQLHGALRFRSLLRRWLGDAFDAVAVSTPFRYLVARDSILTPAELTRHFQMVDRRYHSELVADPALDYLGTRPERLYRPVPTGEGSPCFTRGYFTAEYETAELAIDTAHLSEQVRAAITAHPRITLQPGCEASELEDLGNRIRVDGTGTCGPWTVEARHVVNATWESRLRLDRQFGLAATPGWLYRLKYRLIARLPDTLRNAPSATMVTGRYGDVVIRPDGTAYLSWYPAGLQGWSHDIAPPADWDGPCRGEVDAEVKLRFAQSFVKSISEWFPGIRACAPLLVDAGVIVAYGASDVDDKSSGLHDRTRVGVTSAGHYHSIDPGKLTTAPHFARIAAERIAQAIRLEAPNRARASSAA